MNPPVFHSGFFGTAAVGGNELPIISWNIDPSCQLQIFKNSKSGGYVLREATYQDCSVGLNLEWDSANNAFQAPLNLTVGQTLTNLFLYLHETAAAALNGSYWSFTSLIIARTPQTLNQDGKISTSINLNGNGSFTYPV